jgi:predicted dehydrogenase
LVDQGDIGLTMMVRGRYGHGGRLGYEREWRAMPGRGGGELLDQGVHMIDLAGLFLGSFTKVTGFARTLYWPMMCDDNAFMLLETDSAKVAQLHVSCSEWKNIFSLEVYGTKGKLHIEGLGGSYGVERLTLYRMLPEMGPPETTIWEYPGPDLSWKLEMQAFLRDIELDRSPSVGLAQARAALEVVEKIRSQSGER